METDTIVAIIWIVITLAFLTGVALVIFYGMKKYSNNAEKKIEPILIRLKEINGSESTIFVDLYLIYGVFESNESLTRVYLTNENIDEVLLMAQGMKEFCWRFGILSHGVVYVPFIIWYNYRKAFKIMSKFRQ